MRILLLSTAIVLGGSQTTQAQGIVYGVAGGGGYGGWFGGGAGFHVAGGGEVLARGVVGAGGEYGIFGNTSSVLSVMSFNGVVHLSTPGSRTSPFLTSGYSRFSSGEGAFHAWNIGVGADFWGNEHAGVRVEFRDHVRRDTRGTVHYFSIRAGIALK